MQKLNKITHTIALVTGCFSASALAADYNDPYWNDPNVNSSFVDHFDAEQINRQAWKVEQNIFVNGEDIDYQDVEYPQADWTIRTGQPDTDALDGKALNLKARYMDGEIQDYYGGDAQNPGKPLFIRAGRIESQITDDTTFTYGKFEARIKMPPARNAEFPAWWLLGNYPDVGWTACQELDIVEWTGANADKLPQTYWTAPYAVHGGTSLSYQALGINDATNTYNTYGVIKTPDKVEWYVNGELTQTFSRENQGDDQPWPYVTPMRMILNHAITHTEWPDVGNYNKFTPDENVANRTGYSYVDENGVRQYEYLDTQAMGANIGREGTDFLVDYVAHWPLPASEPTQKYVDDSKYSFFRETGNTKGFYNLRGWLAPVAVTADDYDQPGYDNDHRDNGPDNAADGYVGSKWATPNDDELHWVEIDYGSDKNINYFWIEWAWNLPKAYDIYGKSTDGDWEFILNSEQENTGWATHTFDINKTYRYVKLVTKGRIDKANPVWLLEFKAFEDVANMYPKPAGTVLPDRSVNMLTNGDFSQGSADWTTEAFDGADSQFDFSNAQAQLSLTDDGANYGSVQLHTSGFGLKSNYKYRVQFSAAADTSRQMIVRLSDNDLNPTQTGTHLYQTLQLTTAMTDYQFEIDYTQAGNTGRLAFLFGELGTAGVSIDDVVIQEVAYIGTGEPLVPAINPSNFSGASAGWENEWWGVAQRAVDGSLGTKASGNDGQAEGLDLDVSVQIDPHYEIKAIQVAGDNSPERSLAQFKAEFANGTSLIDWTDSTTEGSYEQFDTFVNQPPVSEQNFKFFFRPPAGELVEVTDVQLLAIDHMPHRIYSMTLDQGGSISPAGTIRYNRSNTDSATYYFNADAGSSVSNVIIDGVSYGAIEKYTFTNIDSDHTIAVAFGGGASQVVNLSQYATATASSELTSAQYAIDGDAGSRWESAHNVDPTSITLNFNQMVDLASIEIDWEAANAADYQILASVDGQSWQQIAEHTGGAFGARSDQHTLQGQYQYLQILGTARSSGNMWGYSIYEIKVMGSLTGAAELDLTSQLTITSTSELQSAQNMLDGDSATRWESIHADNTVQIDFTLPAAKQVSKLEIDWEAANAGSYQVLGSNDGVTWQAIGQLQDGQFGARSDVIELSGTYQYIRLELQNKSTGNQWGYSIYETRLWGY
ncbi:discoidin domain-containing protein [Catenovulum sp. SX2]|uniref:discoidin domain-containing protein n=1 Tax=Catenovulum sp. SX2 TaxID=3398614 RepID=UPI003F861CF4